jgi:hypothetical protein
MNCSDQWTCVSPDYCDDMGLWYMIQEQEEEKAVEDSLTLTTEDYKN